MFLPAPNHTGWILMNGEAETFKPDPSPMPTSYRAGDEPIPGYRLIEPLGKGGFGEVWKCQAPGGFLKAIKFVGDASAEVDGAQQLADQELKSLELIRNIRHPFILTVERSELLRGTLMIVMELADRNMADLLLECQARGLPGIPRAELLNYLAEAAEALDLMNFQHALQHLDIKPQNLFLVASHAKVADFGMVNRLPEKKATGPSASTHDMLAHGITPRYVAPEILRHRMSRRTDQYSLAIVYQELLTGSLPFKGRTARQLIMQHMQALPDLGALPEHDRSVVARALAKDPEERFQSCQDFVRALRRCGPDAAGAPADESSLAGAAGRPKRTDSMAPLKGHVSLKDYTYVEQLGQTPLGEVWHTKTPNGETRWACHLQGFRLEAAAVKDALTYLQSFQHAALLRFKVGEIAAHRIILIFEPWGPSLSERCRSGKLSDQDLLRALAEAAHAVDELTAQTNLEHLRLCPDTLVQGLDGEQLRDFGLISALWKSGQQPLAALNPRYGAPELAHGRTSAASDQHSLAVIYADLRALQLTGKMWPAPTASTKTQSPAVALANIPGPEREVLLKALDADPGRRFSTCAELIDALAVAQGGAASQTTTAVHSALGATQESFLATLEEWITQQEAESSDQVPEAAAADGSLRHVCTFEIVPGTAKLHLQVFQQEWEAQWVAAGDDEFRFFLPLRRSLWQRLCGTQVGVDVRVALQPLASLISKHRTATLSITPKNCNAVWVRKVRQTIGPALLQSLRKCLNANADRRRAPRLPFRENITVRHRAPGCAPTEHHGQVVNVSRTGIGFVASSAFERGEIRIFLCLPQPGEQPMAILLKGTVRRCQPLPNGKYEIGAEFVRNNPASHPNIGRI